MTQVASQFEMSLPGVSKHVSVLEDAGLVRRWRSGRSHRCLLEIGHMESANEWIVGQMRFWTHSMDAPSFATRIS
jgi:DNA-binding transcriptional ArsR family regulator